jgi:putative tricarboxylic transport membrane protein
LGIPGSPTTAILLGALMVHGLMPGPDLFEKSPKIVYSIFVSLFLSCILMFIVGFALSKVWSLTLNIHNSILTPIIFGFCIIGAYCGRYLMLDVYLTLGLGALGYIFKKFDFPMAPLVLALVLGNIMESNLRRSLLISGNDFKIFFTRPISCILIIIAILSFFLPLFQNHMKKRKVV